jgi:hypothetical protein
LAPRKRRRSLQSLYGLLSLIIGCTDRENDSAPSSDQRMPAVREETVEPSRAGEGLTSEGGAVYYSAPRPDDPDFVVVAGRKGRGAQHILELTGSGAGLLDYDNDGWLDIYVVSGQLHGRPVEAASPTNHLLRNRGDGTFTDVTESAGVGDQGYGFGVAAADFDNDGAIDLFVSNWGADVLYRNRGDGRFDDVTQVAGVAGSGWSASAAWGDVDRDGDLDLYVCRYFVHQEDMEPCSWAGTRVPCGPPATPPERDFFYRNNGDGTFHEVSAKAGLQTVAPAFGLGVTFCDFNDDGHPDIYVANDVTPNFLFQNQGDGSFEEVGLLAGVAFNLDGREQSGMGVDVADFDGDGLEDFFVTNFSADYNTLYRNEGHGFFTDVTAVVGLSQLAFMDLGWATRFFDADCDGDLDLFVANGHVYPHVDGEVSSTFAQKNHLYLWDGTRYQDATNQSGPGLSLVHSSRGAAFGDLNNDGWMDAVVVELNKPPSILRARPQSGQHRVLIHLETAAGESSPELSKVTVKAAGRVYTRRCNRGGSYCSSNDPRIHFGLGKTNRIDELVVHWSGGGQQTFRNLAADRLYTIRRGSQTLRTEPLQ